ncbi:phosphate regulon sensor histidine kinase PhoR [Psychrobium sp. 1_MG-2023]|uniref:phosphate regulon sensor histidine kinase PhoR n=1 Tax=Psychrobium sp. 1_MG-2023 TaxID=3062624 RepID=UPI000C34F3FD|nr:phosphate regulon sensor histidine kinase PhoR [Psychrobium sp. 1_MG-2023]MDP2560919.1 phosphate regulon sensor histidine kinase PhoR [Psychrobium sp. 1_MG-2023]PKF55993.1 two-component system sensor histidine kinase PhoR [Alteromonadales bacterium alter-6D02]
MLDHRLLHSIIIKFAAIYAALTLVGLLIGQVTLTLLLGSLVIVAVNLKQFYRLVVWLWQTPQKNYVSDNSSWDHIYYGMEKIQRANRKRRRQLIHSLGEFRQGADALPDGVVVYNQENNILWCNSQARLLFGFQWPTDQGQRLDNLIRYPAFSEYLAAHDFEHVLLIPSPVNEDILLENRVIKYGLDQYLLVSRDVTRIHQLEEMRREFVANVSHELKTPLTVLQGYLELINDSDDGQRDPSLAMAASAMKLQASRMQSMVEQLLSLSKIESAAQASIQQQVSMSAQLKMLKTDALSLIGERDLVIEFAVDEGVDVYGDEAQIFSACTNLVTNAIRYCPDGSFIQVLWQRCDGGALFSVTDNGPGIAANHLARLTERFYRIDQSRSSKSGGSGLGLSIVKHVLVNHQSNLNIESTPGLGSCFSFIIRPERLVKVNDNKRTKEVS